MVNKKKKIIAVSGGFDPIHFGHIRLFESAKKLGDELVVIINNDNWLLAKKGFVFMPEDERAQVISALRAVDRIMLTRHKKNDPDKSVCRELSELKPSVFANGGDRNLSDSKKNSSSLNPEVALCKKLGIKLAFNVGAGGKVQSSSWLLDRYLKTKKS